MPPVTFPQIGLAMTMVQNQIYAMPIRKCTGYVSPAAAVLEGNSVNSATGMVAITVEADGSFTNSAQFFRCTDVGGCSVIFKV